MYNNGNFEFPFLTLHLIIFPNFGFSNHWLFLFGGFLIWVCCHSLYELVSGYWIFQHSIADCVSNLSLYIIINGVWLLYRESIAGFLGLVLLLWVRGVNHLLGSLLVSLCFPCSQLHHFSSFCHGSLYCGPLPLTIMKPGLEIAQHLMIV